MSDTTELGRMTAEVIVCHGTISAGEQFSALHIHIGGCDTSPYQLVFQMPKIAYGTIGQFAEPEQIFTAIADAIMAANIRIPLKQAKKK